MEPEVWRWSLEDFGERVLRPQRKKLGLTVQEMARRIGVHHSQISRVERGLEIPRDFPTAKKYAEGYQLEPKQTIDWFQLLCGGWQYDIDVLDALIEELQNVLDLKAQLEYAYFSPLRHRQDFAKIDRYWPEIQAVIHWLLNQKRGPLKATLLVEFGLALPHYLDAKGYYQTRHLLAVAAAQAAQELERKTIEAWLRADAIPAKLIEHYHDATAARFHLERAIKLAKELGNTELMGLATTFLAQTHLLQQQVNEAEAYIHQALDKACSPVIQARTYWVAGDIAFLKRQFEPAVTYYTEAQKASCTFAPHAYPVTAGLKLGKGYLALYEITPAREQFTTFLAEAQTTRHYPFETALATFRLAQVAQLEGDGWTARQHGREAETLFQSVQVSPQFQQSVKQFRAQKMSTYEVVNPLD